MIELLTKRMATHEKARLVAEHIIMTHDTIRKTATVFNVSRSSVHSWISKNLEQAHPETYAKVRAILDYHLSIRHLRGGEATKIMHRKRRAQYE